MVFMKTFILNGKSYAVKDIDFNMICDLEEQGISLEEIEKKPMSMIRTYVAFCMGANSDVAGKEIENHLINGGNMNDIANVMGEAMKNSGFFQALNKRTQKETSTVRKKKGEIVSITEA